LPAFAARPPVAQARASGDSFQVDPGRIGLISAGGTPLPDAVRGQMEAALGADFSAVRVHVGPQAARIGAVAFTMGNDLYFAPGRFQPDTIQGKQLLGHELAHVVQQRAGRVRNPLGAGIVVVQDRGLEAEADRLGYRAAAHRGAVQAKRAPGTAELSSQQKLANKSPGGTVHRSSIRALPSSIRAAAQGMQLKRLFGGAVQLRSAPAIASHRPENQKYVIQALMVGGIDVTYTPGYASWTQDSKGWHINWTLGEKDVYHVTDESVNPKKHYYFTYDGGVFEDAVAPKGMKGRKGSSAKFSKLPSAVKTYIEGNYAAILRNYALSET
jgi:hypothetical protein